MNRYTKHIVIIVLLIATFIYAYATPRPKYTGTKILASLKIPAAMPAWISRDVSGELNLQDEKYKFVSDVFARVYVNRIGEHLLFLVLDAGNFHNPQVCFGAGGAKVKELPDITFNAAGRVIKAHALYAGKGGEGTLVIYWICIDKRITDWTGQKIKQLWYSVFNKKKTGLMVRFDIPTTEYRIDNSIGLAKEFLADVSKNIPPEQIDYILGKM